MSEQERNLILENYSIGEAITSHNGVVCYPAMRKDTDDKYILKVISFPESNVKLAALLLSGAYSSREDALSYYKELAQEILLENRTMNELSNLEGFHPYINAHLTSKQDGNGYEVWLLARYQQSLAQLFSETAMTHRGIMDLALDLCSALAACRRAGYLYIDLKPDNIFHDPDHGYCIADLGFMSLASLQYASLPDKYFSIYTAPEITDAGSQLNDTLDVYALGLILYQAYNGGALPIVNGKLEQPLLPPVYADYEMAQIILTACHPDPEKRWKDPTSLGQAMVQYMQNFGAEDISIIPSPVTRPELDVGEDFLPEDSSEPEEWMQDPELAFMQELVCDDTAPNMENITDFQDSSISEETSQMLAQADDLIAHETPKPAVASEPVFTPMPDPIMAEDHASPTEPEQNSDTAEASAAIESTEADALTKQPANKPKKIITRIVAAAILLCLLVGAVLFGIHYYQHIYLQSIENMVLTGTVDSITVQLHTLADEQLLTVTCSDTYGNTLTSSVANGLAVFNGLSPHTRYTIRVSISGTHKLTGAISDSFTTGKQTNVDSFTASIGPEDGSVYLNFTVSGSECDTWLLTYSAGDTEEKTISFAGHSVTVYDLTIGSEYNFTLSSNDSNVVGESQISYRAREITRAQNPVITACGNGLLTVQWESPTGESVDHWIVRCSDASGYDQTITTEDLCHTFTGLCHETTCTVEITAEGMPLGVVVSISAEPVTVTQFGYHLDDPGNLLVTWDYVGGTPEGGWYISWSCDNAWSETLISDTNSIALPHIPGGSYSLRLTPVDGKSIFGDAFTFTLEPAADFSDHGITKENLQLSLFAMPAEEDWQWDQLPAEAFKTVFTPDETAAILIRSDVEPETAEEPITVTLLVRNEEGILLNISVSEFLWNYMWNHGICTLNIPVLPDEPGNYSLFVYFDGMILSALDFSIE